MAVTISKLNVILSGNMGGLTSVLNAGGAQVLNFEHTVESAGSRINGILAGLGIGISIAGVAEYIHHTMEAVDANAKLADSLGITSEALARLEYAGDLAGASTELIANSLTKLQKNLAEAQSGAGPAADAFRKMGLDAKDLINLRLEQAVDKIADASRGMGNASDRTSAIMEIFGKSGRELLPLLLSGSKGLQDAAAEADKFGLSLSRVDESQIEAANDAITRVEKVIEGAASQLAVKLAPYLQATADKLVEIGTRGEGMAGTVTRGFHMLTEGIATGADYLELLEAGYYKVTAAGGYWITLAMMGIDKLAHGIDWLDRKLGGSGFDLSFLDGFVDGMDKTIDELNRKAGEHWENWSSGKARKAVAGAFQEIENGSRSAADAAVANAAKTGQAYEEDAGKGIEAAAKKLEELQKQVDEFGMSKGDKAAHDVALAGGDQAQQAQAKTLADQLDQMEQVKKSQDEMAQDAKKMWMDSLTPAEKYANEMAKIETLHSTIGNDGNPLIDDETAARAAAKAADDLEKAGGDADKKHDGPKLLEAGSQDVAKFVAEVQQRQRGEEHQREILATAKTQTDHLKAIRDAITAPPSPDETQSIFNV